MELISSAALGCRQRLGEQAPAFLTFFATVSASVFYGMDENAMLFWIAAGALLLAATFVGPRQLADGMAQRPLSGAVAVAALLLIGLSYHLSSSKDSSIGVAWSLALLPLTFVVTRELGAWAWRVHGAVSAVVLVFSAVSVWKFAAYGEQPSLPLTDPNNYCTLIYVALLPWTYIYLSRAWQGRSAGAIEHLGARIAFGLMTGTVFSTQSRAGALVVVVALAIFLVVAVSRRVRLWPLMALIGAAVCVYVAVSTATAGGTRFNAQELNQGLDVRGVLNGAAWQLYLERPLMGAGLNVFALFYRMSRSPLDQETSGLSVHNDYLQLLAEGGPLLLAVLLVFTIAVVNRFTRMLVDRREMPPASFGVLTALGAALAHAGINFVLYSPVLACFLGISAALVRWSEKTIPLVAYRRKLRFAGTALLAWGWCSFAYLGVDVLSLGVFSGQDGIPLATAIRENPERALDFSRFAQTVNRDRGLPVLAEAVYHHARLARQPQSKYLQDLTLNTYRRARQVDPWNTQVLMGMYDLIESYPGLLGKVTADEHPTELLLRCIELDPIFLPAFDRLRAGFEAAGRVDLAYRLIKERLGPWLEWLARHDPSAASRVLAYLREGARQSADADYEATLDAQAQQFAKLVPVIPRMWFRPSGS